MGDNARAALRERAQTLRDQGWTLGRVAGELGYASHVSVSRLLRPEAARAADRRDNARRAAAKRAWENEHDRGACACGTMLAVGARRRGIRACSACHLDMVKLGRAMRCERIYEMWHEGRLLREIAVALDSTAKTISTTLTRMRQEGWDVPQRPPGGYRKGART